MGRLLARFTNEGDQRGATLAVEVWEEGGEVRAFLTERDEPSDMWGPPFRLVLELDGAGIVAPAVGRNRYVLALDVELTKPLGGPGNGPALEAAELLAKDVGEWLREADWGFGRARISGVYAPASQWAHGDFVPEDEQ